MTTSRRTLLAALALLAQAAHAQPGLVMAPPPLPLRNVLIEVRQDDGENRASERIDADVRARVQAGQSEVMAGIDARSRQSERSARAQQQVLVLNGRPAAIVLGHGVPLRLRQIVTRNGVRVAVPGTVWLQAGTGFTATPLWEGGETVYLELAATQGRQPLMGNSASTNTTLMLPLGAWMTVAESDDVQDNRQGALGLGGGAREQGSSATRLRVQVRVSVP
jgi:hypothetical protein